MSPAGSTCAAASSGRRRCTLSFLLGRFGGFAAGTHGGDRLWCLRALECAHDEADARVITVGEQCAVVCPLLPLCATRVVLPGSPRVIDQIMTTPQDCEARHWGSRRGRRWQIATIFLPCA